MRPWCVCSYHHACIITTSTVQPTHNPWPIAISFSHVIRNKPLQPNRQWRQAILNWQSGLHDVIQLMSNRYKGLGMTLMTLLMSVTLSTYKLKIKLIPDHTTKSKLWTSGPKHHYKVYSQQPIQGVDMVFNLMHVKTHYARMQLNIRDFGLGAYL